MVFTVKQKEALAKAQGPAKKALAEAFRAQMAGHAKVPRTIARPRNPPGARDPGMAQTTGWRAANPNDFQFAVDKALKTSWKRAPQSGNLMAPQGMGYYDAFTNDVSTATTHSTIGPATGICCKTVCGVENPNEAGQDDDFKRGIINTAEGPILLYLMPAASNVQAVMFRVNTSGAEDVVDQYAFRTPQLTSSDERPNLLPTSLLATRASVQIRNTTAVMNLGGEIRVLRQPVGFEFPDTIPGATNAQKVAALGSLIEGVRTSAMTKPYTGPDLTVSKQINSIVVDQSRANTFKDFELPRNTITVPWQWVLPPPNPDGSQDPPDRPDPRTMYPFEFEAHDPAYTPIAILFEPYVNTNASGATGSEGNKYECTYLSQFLCHYRQGTILANLAAAPRSHPALLDRHRQVEDNRGSALMNVASAVGRAAYNNRGAIAGAIGALL